MDNAERIKTMTTNKKPYILKMVEYFKGLSVKEGISTKDFIDELFFNAANNAVEFGRIDEFKNIYEGIYHGGTKEDLLQNLISLLELAFLKSATEVEPEIQKRWGDMINKARAEFQASC